MQLLQPQKGAIGCNKGEGLINWEYKGEDWALGVTLEH